MLAVTASCGSAAQNIEMAVAAEEAGWDAFMAWDNTALAQRVKNCVVQSAKCNTAGDF